jgi:hypothetical protein
MTFIAKLNSLCLWFYQMRHRDLIINLCMTLYTSHISKMCCLIWEPVVLFNNIDLFLIAQKLITFIVGMTIKANRIIISYGLLKVVDISD